MPDTLRQIAKWLDDYFNAPEWVSALRQAADRIESDDDPYSHDRDYDC